ncbi:MAG: alpha/beta hydrolase [Bacteroidota bacterium]|nr:alpha/beta hydrolase [Bacteroidota bacterium]
MMYVAEFGSGKNIAFGIHGWGGDHRTFVPLLPYMPPQWRLVAVDLPGYGKSPPARLDSIEIVADALAEHVRRCETPVVLVGSCSGAVLALETALRMPNHIERIVALDLFATMPWYFRLFTLGTVGSIAYHLTFGTEIGRKLVNAFLWFRRTRSSDLTSSFSDKDAGTTQQYLHLLGTLPGPERYHALKVPVTLVWGERTFRGVREAVPRWQRILAIEGLHCIPQAGHLLIDEAPARVASLVFAR